MALTTAPPLSAPLLYKRLEFRIMLVDFTPQQIRFAAQRHEHFARMPCAARACKPRIYSDHREVVTVIKRSRSFITSFYRRIPTNPTVPQRMPFQFAASRNSQS